MGRPVVRMDTRRNQQGISRSGARGIPDPDICPGWPDYRPRRRQVRKLWLFDQLYDCPTAQLGHVRACCGTGFPSGRVHGLIEPLDNRPVDRKPKASDLAAAWGGNKAILDKCPDMGFPADLT